MAKPRPLPRSQYLAALRRRKTPADRQRFRKRFDAVHHPKQPAKPKAPKGPKAPKQPESLIAPLTPQTLRKERNAASELQFGTARSELGAQRRTSALQTRRIPEYFGHYQQQLEGLRAASATQAGADQAALLARANDTSAQDSSQRAQLSAREAESAAQRGATPDPQLDRTSQQAATSRRSTSDIVAAVLGARSGAQQDYVRNRQAAGGQAQIEALGAEHRYARGLDQKGLDLAKQIGAFKADYTSKARQSERDYALKLGALNMDQSQLEAKVAGERAQRAVTKRGQNVTKRGQDISSADRAANRARQNRKDQQDFTAKYGVAPDQWNRWSAGHRKRWLKTYSGGTGAGKKPTSGPGSLTNSQEHAHVDKIEHAQTWIERLTPNKNFTPGSIRNLLKTGGSLPGTTKDGRKTSVSVPRFDQAYINAAFDLVRFGHLSPANVRALHKLGVHVPAKWRKQQTKYPGSPNAITHK